MSLTMSLRRLSLAGAVVLAACGGGDDGGTTNPPPIGGFSVSLSSTTLSVVAGGTGSVTATIARTGSFSGTVDLSTEGVPGGITAAFSPAAITSGTTSTTLNVSVAASVTPGNYQFTIRGKATGLADQTATVSMTVTAPPSIALALTANAATLEPLGTTTFTANLTRTNFTGAVTVAVTGLPANVAANVVPNGDAYAITLSVQNGAAPGTYPLTVTASGTGVSNATAPYTLTVLPPPAASLTITTVPTTLAIQQGANGQVNVVLSRLNFAGAVALTLTGAPAGVTHAFGQSNVTGNSTTLTLSVGGAVPAGRYTLVVKGTATGVADATANITLDVTAAPAGSIALALSAPNATVNQGANTTFMVNITRTNYAGDVNVALTGLPAGVTPTITTSPTQGNSVQVQLAVGANVVPGSYGVTVTGTGTGIPAATAQFNLTVAPAPAIVIAATPTAATVQQGNSTQFTVNITRTNFAGNVTLAVSGAPAGVTTAVATSPTAGNSAVVTVNVGAGAGAGNYTLTVTGSGTGIANATTAFQLTVTATQSSGNVTWSFASGCNAVERPIWFAAQNGNGPWTQVVPNGTDYSFTVTTSGAIAYVTQNGADDFDINFFYGSQAELGSRGAAACTPAGKTVNGSVAGLSATNTTAQISLGSAFAQVQNPATTFQLTGVASGSVDLVATRQGINIANPLAGFTTNKVIIRRALNPADGSTLPVLDFNAGEAFDPDTKSLTINGIAGGEIVSAATTYFTANQGFGLMGSTLFNGATGTYVAVPSARQAAGDLHIMSATGILAGGGAVTSSRIRTEVFRDAQNRTVTLPSALSTPTFSSLATAPYVRTRAQLTRQAEYDQYWTLGYGQTGRAVTVFVTSGYLGASAFDFQFPDFTTVSGWQNTWGPVAGRQTTWTMSASGWTLGGSGGFGNTYSDGTVINTGARTGQFTP